MCTLPLYNFKLKIRFRFYFFGYAIFSFLLSLLLFCLSAVFFCLVVGYFCVTMNCILTLFYRYSTNLIFLYFVFFLYIIALHITKKHYAGIYTMVNMPAFSGCYFNAKFI